MKIRLLSIITIIIQCIPSILSATSNNQKESSSSYYYVVRSPKVEKRSYTEDEALTHQKEKTKIDTAIQTYTKTTNTSSSLLSPASLSITSSSSYGNNVKKNNGAYNVKPNVTMNAESIYQDKNSLKYVKTVKKRREISEVIKHIPKSTYNQQSNKYTDQNKKTNNYNDKKETKNYNNVKKKYTYSDSSSSKTYNNQRRYNENRNIGNNNNYNRNGNQNYQNGYRAYKYNHNGNNNNDRNNFDDKSNYNYNNDRNNHNNKQMNQNVNYNINNNDAYNGYDNYKTNNHPERNIPYQNNNKYNNIENNVNNDNSNNNYHDMYNTKDYETNRNPVNYGSSYIRSKLGKPDYSTPAERNNEQNYPSTPNTANEQSDNQESNQYGKEKEKDTDFNSVGQDVNPLSSLNPFGGLFSLGQMGNGGSGF
ncbi:unnamed protein product [Schistosoma guineensis]|nr:unnamed protein product [Schistosoma guineensis]